MVSFQTKKYQFVNVMEELGVENVVIYSGHFEYFTTIGYIYVMGIW
jgi:hypothetical protein